MPTRSCHRRLTSDPAPRPSGSGVGSRLFELLRELLRSGVDHVLEALHGMGDRFVERLLERRLADEDKTDLMSRQLAGGVLEFLAGERPKAELLGDDAHHRA